MKWLCERESRVFYEFKGTRPSLQEIDCAVPGEMALEHHIYPSTIPPAIYQALFPYGYSLLLHRMKHQMAEIVALSAGEELVAYGWMQKWAPFRRLYKSISSSGTMIGPAWTSPRWRGRGIHVLMLKKRLYLAPLSQRVFSFVEEKNHASRKGLIRSGFTEVARLDYVRVAGILRYCRKAKDDGEYLS